MIKLKLNGIEPLYRDMKVKELDRYKFLFQFRNIKFDVFFFIDEEPYILLFGVQAENFSFEIKVIRGFNIEPIFDNNSYIKLAKILGFKPDPANPFRPIVFFEDFNQKVPSIAEKRCRPKPHEVAVYRRNVEESDKIYYMGWRDNNLLNQNVSEENLEKTRQILGIQAYDICKRKNLSTRWTDDKMFAKEWEPPN